MAQQSSKQRAEEAVLDLNSKLRQLNKALAGKGATIAENAPLVATIKAVEGMTAGGGGFSYPIYKLAQFEAYPEGTLPPMHFVRGFSSGYSLFSNSKLEEVPAIEGWDSITAMDHTFNGCSSLKKAVIGSATSVASLSNTFSSCRALEVVDLTTSARLGSLVGTFSSCTALREIKGVLDLSGCTSTYAAFQNSNSVEEVRIKGLKADIDLSACAKLSVESVRYLVDNLQQSTGKTISLASAWQMAHTAEAREYAKKAAAKGFTLNFR